LFWPQYCFSGLVIRVRAYRSRGPGSIPDATRFSEEEEEEEEKEEKKNKNKKQTVPIERPPLFGFSVF
jgi:hypothetical protein